MKEGKGLLGWAVTLYAIFSLGSMATMNIAAGVVLLAIVLEFVKGRLAVSHFLIESRRPATRLLLWLSGLLALACALSLIVGKLYPLSYTGRSADIRFFADFAKAWYLFWPFVLVTALRMMTPGERTRALRAWFVTFAVLSVLGLFQFVTGWPRHQAIPGHEPFFHVTLFFGHHLSVASILIFPFFAALDGLVSKRKAERLGLPRVFWLLMGAAGALALFGTYSRMLWGALPLGILLWVFLSLRGKWRWVLVGTIVALGLASLQWEPVRSRVHAGMGIQERVQLWRANLDFFSKRPLTGVGWRNTEELSAYYFAEKNPGVTDFFVGHAHNNLLEMLGGTGALGTLAWLAWSLGVLWLAWNASRGDSSLDSGERDVNFARGLFCAWVVFQLNGLTQVNFWEGKVMHQMSFSLAWILLWAGIRKNRAGLSS